MSADNYCVIKKKADGYYWGDFSASYDWDTPNDQLPDEEFTEGPFGTSDEAIDNAADDRYWEYGIELIPEEESSTEPQGTQ